MVAEKTIIVGVNQSPPVEVKPMAQPEPTKQEVIWTKLEEPFKGYFNVGIFDRR